MLRGPSRRSNRAPSTRSVRINGAIPGLAGWSPRPASLRSVLCQEKAAHGPGRWRGSARAVNPCPPFLGGGMARCLTRPPHSRRRETRMPPSESCSSALGPAEPLSLGAALEHSSTDRWRVSEVEGTEEGLAVLHTERFHLLVLDDDLLIATRRKSLEVLRQAAPSTPIILRTTYRSRQAEADAAQVGVEAVLPRDESAGALSGRAPDRSSD